MACGVGLRAFLVAAYECARFWLACVLLSTLENAAELGCIPERTDLSTRTFFLPRLRSLFYPHLSFSLHRFARFIPLLGGFFPPLPCRLPCVSTLASRPPALLTPSFRRSSLATPPPFLPPIDGRHCARRFGPVLTLTQEPNKVWDLYKKAADKWLLPMDR